MPRPMRRVGIDPHYDERRSMVVPEVVGILVVLAVPLVALAHRWRIPYPIVLVFGGLVLGFLNRPPQLHSNPQELLLVFLPPLLYVETLTVSLDEIRRQAGWIAGLAIGLVLVTAGAVAVVAHQLAPEFPWASAILLGAIVAPTDAVAASPVMARLGIARPIVAILQGESLLNDAIALVLYALAFDAITIGTFSPGTATVDLLLAVFGSPLVGLVFGFLAAWAWRTVSDARLQTTISILLPFVTYLAADRLGMSGVVAVVAAGFVANARTPRDMLPEARLISSGFWETIVFLVNVIVFIMIGFALHHAFNTLEHHHEAIWTAIAVVAVVIAVRFAWVYGAGLVARLSGRSIDWRGAFVVAWSGMRGGVSAALALALPAFVGDRLFVERDIVVIATFSVIFVTLVGEGLMLGSIVRWVRPPRENVAAVQREVLSTVPTDLTHHIRGIEHELVVAERDSFFAMRARGEIEDDVLTRMQYALDLIEAGRRAFLEGKPWEDPD